MVPATITLQKSAPAAAQQLLLGFHVLSRKAIQGYQAMDNLPHPLRCSKLTSLPCPSLTSKPTLAALFLLLFIEMYPQPSRAGWGQESSIPISSVWEERRQLSQELLHCASIPPLQTWVPSAKRYHWPRTLTEILWIIIWNSGLIRGNCDLLANILQAVKWS